MRSLIVLSVMVLLVLPEYVTCQSYSFYKSGVEKKHKWDKAPKLYIAEDHQLPGLPVASSSQDKHSSGGFHDPGTRRSGQAPDRGDRGGKTSGDHSGYKPPGEQGRHKPPKTYGGHFSFGRKPDRYGVRQPAENSGGHRSPGGETRFRRPGGYTTHAPPGRYTTHAPPRRYTTYAPPVRHPQPRDPHHGDSHRFTKFSHRPMPTKEQVVQTYVSRFQQYLEKYLGKAKAEEHNKLFPFFPKHQASSRHRPPPRVHKKPADKGYRKTMSFFKKMACNKGLSKSRYFARFAEDC